MPDSKRFTGAGRRYKTKRRVKIADWTAKTLITFGGLGTILAITGVFVFLTSVVVPLFYPAEVNFLHESEISENGQGQSTVLVADEYRLSAWSAQKGAGRIRSFRMDTGQVLADLDIFDGHAPQALTYDADSGMLGAAFADGAIQLVNIGFKTAFLLDETNLPKKIAGLEVGQTAVYEQGIVQRTPIGQLRHLRLEVNPLPVIDSGYTDIQQMAVSMLSSGPMVATLSDDGMFRVQNIVTRRNLLTGQETSTMSGGSLELDLADHGMPKFLGLSGRGDTAYLSWEDGHLLRVDTRNNQRPVVAEEVDLLSGKNAQITALSFLIGKTTLVAGDSQGQIRVWFRTQPENATSSDGNELTMVHDLGPGPAAVTSFAASMRSRLLGAGFADGTVRLFHVTSNQTLAEQKTGDAAVSALAIGPRDDLLAAITPSGFTAWEMDRKHPAATLHTLFGKVHYEGMNEPLHIWQSSSGTDDFEPKYSLVPLIFGTLKATFYSMIFGVPLALLAAVYTTEFLENKALRARIKPLVEFMESLPTVVLGFLAALIFASFVEGNITSVLAAFVTVPVSFVAAAYLFQLMPVHSYVRLTRFRFYLLLILALPAGIWLAGVAGPVLERLLFAGNIKAWLDGQIGTGTGGWFIMFLPVSAVTLVFLYGFKINPWLRSKTANYTRFQSGVVEFSKFLAGGAAAIALAWLLASLLTAIGFDSRGDFPVLGQVMGTYVQRNALVVGFVMGFAIIPAVYTLAEDALSSVPDHLRSGSLAAGATPWQTAVKIIIPTAASGLFSAVMLGLGRAVGETMIVLMATGNTPVMEWNIFNGFRTLSANIAVELPEAVIFGTHFRILFLAALCLFLLTFVINTLAEVIRQRFRKRAFQL